MEKIKVFIGFGLGAILILLCWLVLQGVFLLEETTKTVSKVNQLLDTNQPAITTTVNNIKTASDSLPSTTGDLNSAVGKTKDFVNTVLTKDRSRHFANYLDLLESNAVITTANLNLAVSENLQASQKINDNVGPLLNEGKETLTEVKDTVRELRHQIKQNGDEVKLLLEQGRTLVAKSEVELIATLSNINKTTNGLQILVNDPKLKNTIQSADLTLQNVQVITKELADLSTYLIEPVVRPRKVTGIKRFGQIVLKVFRVLNGTGQVLFLIDRIGG